MIEVSLSFLISDCVSVAVSEGEGVSVDNDSALGVKELNVLGLAYERCLAAVHILYWQADGF